MKLGYWGIQGLCEPIRYLIASMKEFEIEEKKYADQLMRLSSQSAHLLTPREPESQRPLSARDSNAINPIIAKQFVDTA